MKRFVVFVLLIGLFFHQAFAQQPLFKDGDKVCFVGNSITNNGEYINNVFLYYATKYPSNKVRFINCGISGDGASGALKRLDKDVLVHQPNWVVVMFGMNDVNRPLYSEKRKNEPDIAKQKQGAINGYKQRLEELVDKFLAAKTKVILQKPTIYDQTAKLPAENLFGVNDALAECAKFIQQLADKHQLITIDHQTVMNKINHQLQLKDSTATILSKDRVHPQSPGHFVMAYQFLKDTKTPMLPNKTEVDVVKKKGSGVKNLKFSGNKFDFTLKAAALPFPKIEDAKVALNWVPFNQEYNRQVLQIVGVPSGKYQLTIDGVKIGSYNAKQFVDGIDLADSINTPQAKQASHLLALCRKYRDVESRIRTIMFVEHFALSDLSASELQNEEKVKALLKSKTAYFNNDFFTRQFNNYLDYKQKQADFQVELDNLHHQIYQENQPSTHNYQLTKLN